ncbi:ABC transporter permease [Planctomyces sp. SH-PL62]|uniref:ABC transporter permease n=1 Tax=Planctomyces sp. SH-PL62 TaxID=1636152 RepID=UPI00078E5F4C|nr:ABC transporter permease subunit [Planctomyces sp. SH-PL62]AMV39620.1 Inner membrane ABC transporter permease protein YcjP [Planctomyces sp. SH-PL62]
MRNRPGLLGRFLILAGLSLLVFWPAAATILEAARPTTGLDATATGSAIDPAATEAVATETGGLARPARLAAETLIVVAGTEALALPIGVLLALLLFRTDVWGRRFLLAALGLALFVPLPLHATAWLGAFGDAGRMQAFGVRPFLVGRLGVIVVTAMAALPWVVLLSGVGLRLVEPELEESALLEMPARRVWWKVTLRRSSAAIAAAALAVAVLAAGDMTVTDLLQVRTYAEEAYVQFTLGRGPAGAAAVAVPPLLLLGVGIALVGRALSRIAPARLASGFGRSRIWRLGRWRIPVGVLLLLLVGNLIALPLYSLVWRAGRVGGRATLGQAPSWSPSGFLGTLASAAEECREPLETSAALAAAAATFAVALAWGLCWLARASRAWRGVALLVVALTLAAPGPVAGMALLLAYRAVDWIYDAPAIVVLAMAARTLPYAVLVLWPTLRGLPDEVMDAAAVDGLPPAAIVRRVALPLSRRATAAAWATSFVLGLGELPATNLIAPPGVSTISALIWSLLHTGVESHLAGVALTTLGAIALAGGVAMLLLRKVVSHPSRRV